MSRPPRSASTLVPLLIVAFLVAACGSAAESGSPSVPSGSGAPSNGPTSAPSEDPGSSAAPTAEPSPSDDPGTSDEPSSDPSDDPSTEPSTSPSSAGACTGTEKNREFFVLVAESVAWTLYCPVLPSGWNVTAGQWRQGGGGRMEIGYKGPRGAKIELGQGAFCADQNGCVPPGTEIGVTAFGDTNATLVAADDGSWAAVVEQGANPSWLLTGTGLDETEIRAIAAALIVVDG